MSDMGNQFGRYDAVTPGSETTIARFASAAARSGFDGLVVRTPPQAPGTDDYHRIASEFDIELVHGETITATDRSGAGSEIVSRRGNAEVLLGYADRTDLRRFLAGQERLDVLHIPGTDAIEVRYTTVSRAAEHGVAIELDLGPVLRSTRASRVKAIQGVQQLDRFVDHADCPYVVTTTASSHLELRGHREIVGVGETIGLEAERIEDGLRAWGQIVDRTRRARDDRFIEPGVEVQPNETNGR